MNRIIFCSLQTSPYTHAQAEQQMPPPLCPASSSWHQVETQGGAISLPSRLLHILMRGHDDTAVSCNGDRDAACGDARSWIDDAAARAWGALAAVAHDEGDDFCLRMSPFHAALRLHSSSVTSVSWLICPSSWLALTFMMRTWALDFPPTRSTLCHAAWSPMFDILLPPSSAVFAAAVAEAAVAGTAGEAGSGAGDSAAYQLAVAMRRRHVFVEAYTRHRCSSLPLSFPCVL